MSLAEEIRTDSTAEKTLSGLLFTAILIYWAVLLYYALTFGIPRPKLGIGFLGLSMLIYVLLELNKSIGDRNALDISVLSAAGVISIVSTAYFYTNYNALNNTRIGMATTTDYVLGLLIFLAVIYLTYRAFGLPFVFVVAAAIGYAYFGMAMPGLLQHTGLSWERLLQIAVTDVEGIYGNLTRITAAWIALFLLFAGLMQAYGAFDVMFRGALRISQHVKSGVAQSAVIASLIIGSISGSATANTALSGSITIPLMKEHGLKAETAGAIEAVASNGGQIMPPVMGASAFLMASLLARSYGDILIAAAIPGIIYFTSIMFAVHFASIKELDLDREIDIDEELAEADAEEVEELELPIALEAARFGLPIFLLVYLLAIAQWTIISAALWTVGSMVLTGVLFPICYDAIVNRTVRHTVVEKIKETGSGLVIGAKLLAPIAIIIAALNVIADLLMSTGVPSKLTLTLMELSGGIMLVALLLAVILCIILGLGMPTIAAYLIVALLVAPSLIDTFGIPELPAHFFVLYAANLSTITPPIAAGIVVATGIAQSNFWRTSLQAIKISAPIFVLPFMFAYNPEIVTASVGLTSFLSGAIGLLGALFMIYGLNHPLTHLETRLEYVLRFGYLAMGILIMVYPGFIPRLSLSAVAVVVFVISSAKRRANLLEKLSLTPFLKSD